MEEFEKLNTKYNKLLEDNKKVHNILNLIKTHVPHLVFDALLGEILYINKIGRIYYLNKNKEKNCLVCGKDKSTTAHHIIPIRAKCKNKILKELRIRICEECNKLVHPENKVFKQKILNHKDKIIRDLKNKISKIKMKKK